MREYYERIKNADYKSIIKTKWHWMYLVIVSIFMFLIRIRTRERFFSDGKVYFGGNDAWYHFRQTMYSVRNWPDAMHFDPWTGYPEGANVGHFGTLYDQILATVSLLAGLGDPSVETVRTVMVFAPPAFAALTAIVTYLIGKKLLNKNAGLLSATLLAFIPGTFLSRTMVGFADHHAAEVFFISVVVLAGVYCFKAASNRKFILEDLSERGDAFKQLIKYSSILAVATLLYLLVWPPAIMMVGIIGIFYLVYSLSRIAYGKNHESILLLGGLSTTMLGVLVIPFSEPLTSVATILGILHLLIIFGIGLGCFFLVLLHRQLEARGYEKYYVGIVPLIIGVVALVSWIVTPDIFRALRFSVIRNFGLAASDNLQTIGEAQSMISRGSLIIQFAGSYGGVAVFMLLFYAILPLRNKAKGSNLLNLKPEYVFLTVWSFMILLAAMTQVRFNYYLAVSAALTAGIGVVILLSQLSNYKTEDSQGWYYISVTIIILVLIAPTAPFIGLTSVYDQSDRGGPGGYNNWEGGLEWMNDNTPEVSLDKYKRYNEDSFEYSDEEYGVMSWWDYGHWITVTANRIPFANPFQQHAEQAANFLLAQSEDEAESVIDNMGVDSSKSKYVMIDWQMVSPTSKFQAPTVWSDNYSSDDFIETVYVSSRGGSLRPVSIRKKQGYYQTMMTRLYMYHGSAMEPSPVVSNYEELSAGQRTVKLAPRGGDLYRRFSNMSEAREFVNNTPSSEIGGVGIYPNQRVEALEHYRYVMGSNKSVGTSNDFVRNARSAITVGRNLTSADFTVSRSYLKIFERVPGAEIEGVNGPPNSTITASVTIREPNNDDRFRYRQVTETDDNGNFEMTLPYSTTGYENWGPEEGYTNTSVKAISNYTIQATQPRITQTGGEVRVVRESTSLSVPESKVIGEDDSPIEIDFNETDT